MAQRQQMEAPAMKKTSLNLPTELHTELKIAAVQSGREMGTLLAEAVRAYLDSIRKGTDSLGGRRGKK